jgi:hypothetical protein
VVGNRYNEGKAIDAAIRQIEARDRISRADDGWSPDQAMDPDTDRRVDWVCTVGGQLYAFEHTSIEAYENQIKMEEQNRTLFEPVVQCFDNQVPDTEYWQLYVPVDASSGLERTQVKLVQDALIGWIKATATRLPVNRYRDLPTRPGEDSVPGVPFGVSLWRTDGCSPFCGRLDIRPFLPHSLAVDLGSLRLDRLKRTYDAKRPKLAKWRHDCGARTVLVLEENDISLTNEQLVANSMMMAEAGMTDLPDEVFLVSTHHPPQWWVTCLRHDRKIYGDDRERFQLINPAPLVDLTQRGQ